MTPTWISTILSHSRVATPISCIVCIGVVSVVILYMVYTCVYYCMCIYMLLTYKLYGVEDGGYEQHYHL
jgi:hypothetical protein